MRGVCDADAGCLAMNCQSLFEEGVSGHTVCTNTDDAGENAAFVTVYRSTSRRGKRPLPCDTPRTLGIFLRYFSKNGCLFLNFFRPLPLCDVVSDQKKNLLRPRFVLKNGCFFLTKIRNFPKNCCLFLKELRNFSLQKRLFLIRTVSCERGTPVIIKKRNAGFFRMQVPD